MTCESCGGDGLYHLGEQILDEPCDECQGIEESDMEWISVKDRLPSRDTTVLCFCRIYGRYVGSYQGIDVTDFGQWCNQSDCGILPPTHWMPLPEPPKERGE